VGAGVLAKQATQCLIPTLPVFVGRPTAGAGLFVPPRATWHFYQ